MRKAFIRSIRAELARDPKMVVFLGDISVAGFLTSEDQLVDRVYNCGILEQAMISFAAGCSANGLYPVVQTIVPFIVERAFEQIKLDFCAQKNSGLIVGVGGGLEYAKLGYTHHTLWDTAILHNLEGLLLCTPTLGAAEVETVLPLLARQRRLAYVRLTEDYGKGVSSGPYEIGALVRLTGDASRPRSAAKVICGSFPGLPAMISDPDVDVFAYSYPNLDPVNIEELASYSAVSTVEMATMPLLAPRLSSLLRMHVRSMHQQARFFRDYGESAAEEFLRNNWIVAP